MAYNRGWLSLSGVVCHTGVVLCSGAGFPLQVRDLASRDLASHAGHRDAQSFPPWAPPQCGRCSPPCCCGNELLGPRVSAPSGEETRPANHRGTQPGQGLSPARTASGRSGAGQLVWGLMTQRSLQHQPHFGWLGPWARWALAFMPHLQGLVWSGSMWGSLVPSHFLLHRPCLRKEERNAGCSLTILRRAPQLQTTPSPGPPCQEWSLHVKHRVRELPSVARFGGDDAKVP